MSLYCHDSCKTIFGNLPWKSHSYCPWQKMDSSSSQRCSSQCSWILDSSSYWQCTGIFPCSRGLGNLSQAVCWPSCQYMGIFLQPAEGFHFSNPLYWAQNIHLIHNHYVYFAQGKFSWKIENDSLPRQTKGKH